MAPRRRSTRNSAAKRSLTPENESETTTHVGNQDAPVSHSEDEACPACNANESPLNAAEKESWVRCDACKTWYHWVCAGNSNDLETIDKWFCKSCVEADSSRVITLKPPARKSSRKRTQLDYANLDSGLQSDPNRWTRMLQGKTIVEDNFKRMHGSDVGISWLESDDTAMREPFVVEVPEGLGMKMPNNDFSIDDVAEVIGEDIPVEVIAFEDVASQSNSPGWTLGKWVKYYNLDPSARDKTRNVISLEISGTELADKILPPRLVRELDWVEKFWPNNKKGKGHAYPKVQLYCLMGVANAWTDWHIDFAGSSVYYHVLRGSKVFYFIRPTPANLAAYERWSGTELQNHTWLGNMVDEVIKVTLHQGNTMFIPTGWIHAVYTPIDALVFGGNFLHSYNVSTQLKVRSIEIATHVPKKFRFPMFSKLCWYAADKYLRDIKAKEEFSSRIFEGIEALAGFLVSEVRRMERGSEQAKKDAKEQVPSDRVKDAAALARELRWRVRLAAGYGSEDEGLVRKEPKVIAASGSTTNGVGNKRKRGQEAAVDDGSGRFKNFKPRAWDAISDMSEESDIQTVQIFKAEGDQWAQRWLDSKELTDGGHGMEANLTRRREVVVKVRRTDGGVERQRAERVVEAWTWEDANTSSTLSPPSLPTDEKVMIRMDVDIPFVHGVDATVPGLEDAMVVAT